MTAVDPDIELLRQKARAIAPQLSVGLGKVHTRFVADMLTGLLVSGSVRLSEVARALHEPIPEHSTHKRLSRNLGNPEVGRIVASNLLRTAAEFIDAETLLVVDTSELLKPYAAKTQYLAPASAAGDGNRGTRKGYRVCEVVSWDLRGGPMPAFAQLADDLPDNQPELPHRVSAWNDFVFHAGRAIAVVDRGARVREQDGRDCRPDSERLGGLRGARGVPRKRYGARRLAGGAGSRAVPLHRPGGGRLSAVASTPPSRR